MLQFFTLNTIAELICLLVSIICLSGDKKVVWRGMILFLLITCLTEMAGAYIKPRYMADPLHVRPNVWLYNILLVIQAAFISTVFQQFLKRSVNSRPAIIGGLALLGVLYITELISHGIFVYNHYTNTVMLVLFVLYSLFYYYCLLKSDEYVNLLFHPQFWWVAGILFFYFGSTACNIYKESLSPDHAKQFKHLNANIFRVLNIILYSCWSYAFICRKWTRSASRD